MSEGKHSSIGKHSHNVKPPRKEKVKKREKNNSNKSSSKIFKRIFIIVCLLLIASVIYFAYVHFAKPKEDSNNENDLSTSTEMSFENSTSYELSEDGEAKESIYVEGAEYLEIIKFNVIANEDISTVSAKFKNNSNESYEDIELRITLLDDNNVEITSLDYIIDKIEANGEVLAHGAVKEDLSNCTTCTVALRKK